MPVEILDKYRHLIECIGYPERLVLVNLPYVTKEVFNLQIAKGRGYQINAPLGLLYLSASARSIDKELPIKITDLNYELLKHANEDDYLLMPPSLYFDEIGAMWGITRERARQIERDAVIKLLKMAKRSKIPQDLIDIDMKEVNKKLNFLLDKKRGKYGNKSFSSPYTMDP